jgi:hypothetical protein
MSEEQFVLSYCDTEMIDLNLLAEAYILDTS